MRIHIYRKAKGASQALLGASSKSAADRKRNNDPGCSESAISFYRSEHRTTPVRSCRRSGGECATTAVDRRKRSRAHPRKATLMTSRRLCLALSSVCLPARPNASYLRRALESRAIVQTINVLLGRVSLQAGPCG
ncbi:unnamed protein product, partial [Iphiclides podalirius]